jgi:hypothetical protein
MKGRKQQITQFNTIEDNTGLTEVSLLPQSSRRQVREFQIFVFEILLIENKYYFFDLSQSKRRVTYLKYGGLL